MFLMVVVLFILWRDRFESGIFCLLFNINVLILIWCEVLVGIVDCFLDS